MDSIASIRCHSTSSAPAVPLTLLEALLTPLSFSPPLYAMSPGVNVIPLSLSLPPLFWLCLCPLQVLNECKDNVTNLMALLRVKQEGAFNMKPRKARALIGALFTQEVGFVRVPSFPSSLLIDCLYLLPLFAAAFSAIISP